MDNFILPPSPNWHLSKILACNDDGLLAFGSRGDVAIINLKSGGSFDVSFINLAQKDKLNIVVFSPTKGSFMNCLATCGEDDVVRVWDFQESRLLYCHSGHKDGVRVTGLDWSHADYNRVVSVNDLGSIVCWDLASNTIRKLHCGVKVLPLCLACCPHERDIIAVGCKSGVTIVVNIKGNGHLLHRLRANEQDIISLSWCPVPFNVLKQKRNTDSKKDAEGKEEEPAKKARELLLATGGVDKSVFIWRAGSDGRYEVVLNFPNSNINTNFSRKKGYLPPNTMLWTCVLWVDAYTLLSTSQFGELLCWDLNKALTNEKGNIKKFQPRLLHSRHHKGCFSIACPVVYDVVEDKSPEKRLVWTTAMDKHVIACSLASGNITLDIPTMGGTVFSMAISPLDPNRLAIGSSDSKVFVWNMSNLSSLNISSYWKKIVGKVMAMCWHPTEENWLAFGTSDGHVGLLDVGSNKGPTLFRLHHRKPVYRLSWAPPVLTAEGAEPKAKKLVLYSVGDGDVFQFTANPEEPNQEPKSLNTEVLNNIDVSLGVQKSLSRSDIIFKPDNSCFAVGSDNGSVYIVECGTLRMQHVLFPHKKLMNNLEWHPETVSSDNNISPYKNWLATTCENIKVYNIPTEGEPELLATLSGHAEKIVGLDWSPHLNGRLLSASYDCTVQVWDVVSQTCLGVYTGHKVAVMTALFSPQDPDVIISGSADNTVRFWAVSSLETSSKPAKKKSQMVNAMKERSGAEEATELTVGMSNLAKYEDGPARREEPNKRDSTSPTSIKSASGDKGTEDYIKRQKSRALFVATGPKLSQAKHFDVLYQRWVAGEAAAAPAPPPPADEEAASASDLGYLDFFGDDKAMQRLLMVEESRLNDGRHRMLVQNSAIWRGDVSKMIREAITKKQLNDWVVSIAPTAGFDVWEEACAAFAAQLIDCGEVLKASSYLLITHKVYEAVTLLMEYKLYREAIAIAKCRLPPDDPITLRCYVDWGHQVKNQGLMLLAAHCYLAANEIQACIETLGRIKELKSLKMAAMMAKQVGQKELAASLAEECLVLSVVANNHAVGHLLIAEMPQYQYWSVWLKASELLAKVKNRSQTEVFAWLEGRQPGLLNLCDVLSATCSAVGKVYDQLLPHLPTNKTPEYERDMWYYVSGQLAAACAARAEGAPARFLRHTVLALSAAYYFQTTHPSSLSLLLTLSILAPNGLFAKESIFTTEYQTAGEKQLMKSLRAFVCASVVHWLNNNWEKVKAEECGGGDCLQEELKMTWLPELLTNCSADVLDSENVSFYTNKAQKQELQNVLTKENIQKKCEKKVENQSVSKKSASSAGVETVIEKTEEVVVVDKSNDASLVKNGKNQSESKKSLDENLNLTSKPQVTSQASGEKVDEIQKTTEKTVVKTAQETKEITDKTAQNKINVENKETADTASTIGNESSKPVPKPEEPQKIAQSNDEANIKVVKDSQSSATVNGNSDKEPSKNKNGAELTNNGYGSHEESDENINPKLKEIKKLDEVLIKFETERVSVPSPFTAYVNIKYLIDNVISKQDAQLGQRLLTDCNQIWMKSHQ